MNLCVTLLCTSRWFYVSVSVFLIDIRKYFKRAILSKHPVHREFSNDELVSYKVELRNDSFSQRSFSKNIA